MPQSLSFLLIHVVFSTKDRAPVLDATVRPALHAYLATVARNTELNMMNAMCGTDRWGGLSALVSLFTHSLGAQPQAGMNWAVGPHRTAPTIPVKVKGPRLVAANCEWITRFEKKIQATLARVWGNQS